MRLDCTVHFNHCFRFLFVFNQIPTRCFQFCYSYQELVSVLNLPLNAVFESLTMKSTLLCCKIIIIIIRRITWFVINVTMM